MAVLTGATITLSMRVVGVLLVGALIVIPVMVSLKIATGLRRAILLAMLVGVLSMTIGLGIAFYANIAAGGSVVLTAVSLLVITLAGSWAVSAYRRSRMDVQTLSDSRIAVGVEGHVDD